MKARRGTVRPAGPEAGPVLEYWVARVLEV
jgi:hypothetical protein